jgi:hypothetical protein
VISALPEPVYLYAPKDDPFHRSSWRTPYPEAEWTDLRSAFVRSSDLGVSFMFALSPLGAGALAADSATARAKLRRALSNGADGVAILFDDLDGPGPDASLATRQAEFVIDATEGLDCEVHVCPTVYCVAQSRRWRSAKSYLDTLGSILPKQVGLFWTGDDVISRDMDSDVMKRALEALGREPLVWDNYLADDYALRRIYLASAAGRVPQSGHGGYFLNPSAVGAAALWQTSRFVEELASGTESAPRIPEIVSGHPGWSWMERFHHDPWSIPEWTTRMLKQLSEALDSGGRVAASTQLLDELETAKGEMAELCSAAVSMPGGHDLQPYIRDLTRMLGIAIESLGEDSFRDAGDHLRYLLLERLPYEHPLAHRLRDLASGGAPSAGDDR